MFGRLGMSVDDCIEVYKELMPSIFGSKAHWLRMSAPGSINAQYDSKRVKAGIEKVLRERHPPLNEETLFNDGVERRCKVYVQLECLMNRTDS